ncbi:reprolysin-like metallopeptidase [Sinorhizobium sp. BJ1]|uniref:reprolysin-like metallopeptidase n=1 Tax=Sinorhizobium sp. BJ1 TaxID=2035455 RepID=UPI001AECC797|nr:hypothetical protein [Sinorhizobium sp. BJ1]
MFEQVREEQVETVAHELGHVFGLRHFFAKVSEAGYASEIFGAHDKRSIMNYGADSMLTKTDIDDLIRLYQLAWSGALTKINGAPIRLMRPFSQLRQKADLPPQFALVAQVSPLDFKAVIQATLRSKLCSCGPYLRQCSAQPWRSALWHPTR